MRVLCTVVAGTLLTGCVAQNEPRLKKLEEAAAQTSALQSRVKILESRVTTLQSSVSQLQVSAENFKTATFDPAQPSIYERIDTKGGTFLVVLENATPYVDGFRVTCKFGNISSAIYHGFTLKVTWGPRFDAKTADWRTWHSSLRETDIPLTNSLQPGAWNSVSFVIAPAKAEEFGYLELGLEANLVSLRR
jgi:outer membrane murein-binding lipoprotein Lpp